MLETSHLRCFVAVAEEMHFGRAAAKLNMTQPPLSRQIQLLERALRADLFLRTSRSIQLTRAGANFLPEAQRILRLIETASKGVEDISLGLRGEARLGFTASAAYAFLPTLVRAMKRELPEVSLNLREMVSGDQLAALAADKIDIGLLRATRDLSSYGRRTVARDRLICALPAGHRLASKAAIRWRDLHRQEMLMYNEREGRYFHNLVLSRLTLEDIYPSFMQHLSQIHTMLSLVGAGLGVAVVPASAKLLGISGVEYRDFSDLPALISELLVVWHSEDRNPLVGAISRIAGACSFERG